MSFKSILVHLDDGESCKSRLDAGIRLARDFRAQLVGIYLVPGSDVTPSVAAMLPTDVVQQRLAQFADAQHAAEAMFRERAATSGLATIEWRAPAGSPIDTAVAHGRCTDLSIMGQRDPSGSIYAEELVTSVMLASGRPVLVVPYIGAPATMGENVLVAWNGAREASRAVGDALPLLERAKRVTAMVVTTNGGDDVGEHLGEARLTAWLQAHGVDVDVVRHESPDIPTGQWLLSQAADLGSDLVVMGAYGHARMRELVLGGVTQTMLKAMTIPVFMSH
jgi:nucleotide-binding universal stress UspA family protein